MDKRRARRPARRLLWVDLEMTGLDPEKDRILEVAAIVTDWNLKEIATYEGVVLVKPSYVQKRMQKGPAAPFWNTVPQTRDALLAQNKQKGRPARTIEAELLKFVDEHFDKEAPILLAGNSIHMDRRFIEREWKQLNARLHYRMLDVTAWKVVFEAKYRSKFAKREEHRALDDIRGSIEELSYYMKRIKGSQ